MLGIATKDKDVFIYLTESSKADNDEFGSALSDRVVDDNQEFSSIIFGTGFGSITDIKTGPDGFLYIVSIGDGAIYRIIPA